MLKSTFFIIMLLLIIPIASQAKLDEIFADRKDIIEKPFELRDPFQTPKFKSKDKERRQKEFNGKFERNVQKLDKQVSVENVEIVGVLIGKDRRVMIKEGSEVYTLREGEQLGIGGPEIKAILAGGIILVEQIVNIYDEPEYIETVIPISQ